MNSTDTADQGAVRSWLGIPYATADRFRSPKVVPFDPDLPYDQKGQGRSRPVTPAGSRPTTGSARTA